MVPKSWLSLEDEAAAAALRSFVTTAVGQADPTHIVPHDGAHFRRVEEWMMRLIPPSRWAKLSDNERKALTWCAWTHDVGMSAKIHDKGVQPSDIRERHVERSAAWTVDRAGELMLSIAEAQAIATIIPYHSRKYNIERCPERLQFGHEFIRARLLAAYLRLADALDVSNERALDGQEHRVSLLFSELSRASDPTLFHWVKSIVVNSITCDHRTRGVEVQFVRPASYKLDVKKAAVFEYVERFVINEIADELATVEKILARGGVSSYHSISSSRIDLIDSDSSRQIDNSLNRVSTYIQITRSPSASAVTHAALDAISAIATSAKDSTAHFVQHAGLGDTIGVLVQSLDEQLLERPCHVELQRVRSGLVVLWTSIKPGTTEGSVSRSLFEFAARIKAQITPDIRASASSLAAVLNSLTVVPKQAWTFMLFGSSETVAKVIAQFELDSGSTAELYIAEGRPKSQHGAYNSPSYVDGEEYATMVRAARQPAGGGVNPSVSIRVVHLIPDASVATILSQRNEDNSPLVDAVLFGVNGIFIEGGPVVAHTAGHLGIAIAGKHSGVPVIVIGSKAKLAGEPPDAWWKLDRSNRWLTSDREALERLGAAGVDTKRNPKEDHVPLELVTALICDGETLNPSASDAQARIEKWREQADSAGQSPPGGMARAG